MSTRAWIRQVSSLAKGGFLIGLKRFLIAYWFDAQIDGKLQPFCRSGYPQDNLQVSFNIRKDGNQRDQRERRAEIS